MDMMKRVPIAEQAPEERAKNFKEVCLGYTEEEARAEASRCLNCKNPRCVAGCPVSINIPAFLQQVIAGQEAKAAGIIAESSALPAVCGRVCPQETQCEGVCIRGIKGEPVAIGKLERYVADWAREHKLEPENHSEKNGQRVAVIGAGPAGLTCAGDLAKLGYEVKIFEALHEPGGVLVYGIPEFRLPKDTVVAHEVENVKKLGVEIETNTIVGKSVSVDDLLDKEGYDAVFNLFTSFGYFEEEQDDLNVFQSVNKGLKVGGLFVLDYLNKGFVENNFKEKSIEMREDITFYIQKKIENNYVIKQINFSDKGQDFEYAERVKLHTLDKINNYAEKSGFERVKIWGDYMLNSFDEITSPRCINLFKKVK